MARGWQKERYMNEWVLELGGGLREVAVHRHVLYPGRWTVTFHDLGMRKELLDATEIAAACAEAIERVQARLALITEALAVAGGLHEEHAPFLDSVDNTD